MYRNYYLQIIVIVFLIVLLLISCGIYSYTSRDPSYRPTTVCISYLENHVKTQSSDLNYNITEKLMDKINQQENLELVKDSGDIQISGSIKDYIIKPFSIGPNNVAYLNRVELVVHVKFINSNFSEKVNYKDVKAFVEYDAKRNFGTVRDSLNNILSEKMAEEIYDDFFMSW